MANFCRIGDRHACGSPNVGGSGNVFVNGMGAHRFGDAQGHGGIQWECSNTVFVNGLGVARRGDLSLGEPCPPAAH